MFFLGSADSSQHTSGFVQSYKYRLARRAFQQTTYISSFHLAKSQAECTALCVLVGYDCKGFNYINEGLTSSDSNCELLSIAPLSVEEGHGTDNPHSTVFHLSCT